MLTGKEMTMVYETLLMSPGMNDTVKIALTIQRKNVLLLSKAIELGLAMKESPDAGLLGIAPHDNSIAINNVAEELLQKAGLVEVNAKLNLLQAK